MCYAPDSLAYAWNMDVFRNLARRVSYKIIVLWFNSALAHWGGTGICSLMLLPEHPDRESENWKALKIQIRLTVFHNLGIKFVAHVPRSLTATCQLLPVWSRTGVSIYIGSTSEVTSLNMKVGFPVSGHSNSWHQGLKLRPGTDSQVYEFIGLQQDFALISDWPANLKRSSSDGWTSTA